MCPLFPPLDFHRQCSKCSRRLGGPRCRSEQASKLDKEKKRDDLDRLLPFFGFSSICYGSAASSPTSSARISVLVESKVVNGRSRSHLSQIAVTAKRTHVSPLVSHQTASAGLEKPIVKLCGLMCSLPGAIIVANAGFMKCAKHVGSRVRFVPRMPREVCRVIHPS